MSAKPRFTKDTSLGELPRPRKHRVIVTGGSGKLGRATVAYLASPEGGDWEVISADLRRPPEASEDGEVRSPNGIAVQESKRYTSYVISCGPMRAS